MKPESQVKQMIRCLLIWRLSNFWKNWLLIIKQIHSYKTSQTQTIVNKEERRAVNRALDTEQINNTVQP